MLRPEDLRTVPTPENQNTYIDSLLMKTDLRDLYRDSRKETGALVIDHVRRGLKVTGITFTTEDMLASINVSLELSPEESAAVIPDPNDEDKIERTFMGLIYVGSKYHPELFADSIRLYLPKLGGSYLDLLSSEGIEEVAGRYHYVLDADRNP